MNYVFASAEVDYFKRKDKIMNEVTETEDIAFFQ